MAENNAEKQILSFDAADAGSYSLIDVCEYWTADEQLVNLLDGRKEYVRFLRRHWPWLPVDKAAKTC